MKKITLIFLLLASMIASGQISRIRLDMQLIETFTKEEFEKYAKKNSLIPERQEYTLLPSTKIEESSSLK